MSTFIVFLMTAGQLLAVWLGHFIPLPEVFAAAAGYGAPPYMIISTLSGQFAFTHYPLFPLMVLFHLIKYIALARSQASDCSPTLHYTAIICEIGYLISCGYFL